MNKIGCPTYLCNEKYYLTVADDEIEGVYDLPLESHSRFDQLKQIINDVKLWCGDNEI